MGTQRLGLGPDPQEFREIWWHFPATFAALSALLLAIHRFCGGGD